MEHTLWNTFDAARPRLNARRRPMEMFIAEAEGRAV